MSTIDWTIYNIIIVCGSPVYEGKTIWDVIESGLHSLKCLTLGMQILSGLDGNVYLVVYHIAGAV